MKRSDFVATTVTVNKVASVDTYPIPRIDDLYAKLSSGKLFTRLDMRHAYERAESLLQLTLTVVCLPTHVCHTVCHTVCHLHRASFGVSSTQCFKGFQTYCVTWMISSSQVILMNNTWTL